MSDPQTTISEMPQHMQEWFNRVVIDLDCQSYDFWAGWLSVWKDYPELNKLYIDMALNNMIGWASR
jgi:hypothetical protein